MKAHNANLLDIIKSIRVIIAFGVIVASMVANVGWADNVDKGKKVFKKCKSCHSLQMGVHKVGPSLHNVIGRPIASAEGYKKYSKAFKKQDLVWTRDNLAQYLKAPRKFIKGTRMSFAGLRRDKDIENLLDFLTTK